MSDTSSARLGKNLAFIDKIVLVDGTVIDNANVMFRAPVPTEEQLELIFQSSNDKAKQIFGEVKPEWLKYRGPRNRISQHV